MTCTLGILSHFICYVQRRKKIIPFGSHLALALSHVDTNTFSFEEMAFNFFVFVEQIDGLSRKEFYKELFVLVMDEVIWHLYIFFVYLEISTKVYNL